MQSLTFVISIVSEKIAMLKFLPHDMDNQPNGQPAATDYYVIDSHFSYESKIITLVFMVGGRGSDYSFTCDFTIT